MDHLTNIIGPFRLVSGGADGPDQWAEVFVRQQHNWPDPIIHEPNWYPMGTFFKGAGKVRNTKIVKDADGVIAFWDGQSRGTLDSITKAKKMGKPMLIVYADGRMELE